MSTRAYVPLTLAEKQARQDLVFYKRHLRYHFKHRFPVTLALLVICAATWFLLVIDHSGTVESLKYYAFGKWAAIGVTVLLAISIVATCMPLVRLYGLRQPKPPPVPATPPQQMAA